MTRARKTITVDGLRDKVNAMIAATPDEMTGERTALAGLLESVLMESGNYHGFQCTQVDWTRLDDQGYPVDHGDETRRRYY